MPTIAACLIALALASQDSGQLPRAEVVDEQGLLPVNTMYFDLAASSGGDFYFWAPGEFANARVEMPLHGDPVLLAYGTLGGGARQFLIPVETDARTLTLFVGIQRKDGVVLVQPDGSTSQAGAPGVRWHSLQHMVVATIESPPPGIWQLRLAGAGQHAVTVHVNPARHATSPSLNGFDFVEQRGRPGHEGLFPIKRAPRTGESLACRAQLSGVINNLEFSFISIDEQTLSTFDLHVEETGGDLLGLCRIPDQPFRVAVSGRDDQGQPFRRILARLHAPE